MLAFGSTSQLVSSLALFGGIDPALKARVAAEARCIVKPAKHILIEQGDKEPPVFILLSGHVKFVRSPEVGKELYVHLSKPQETIGIFPLWDHQPYSCRAEALTEVRLLRIRHEVLRSLVGESVRFRDNVDRVVQDVHQRKEAMQDRFALQVIQDRLLYTLYILLLTAGEPTQTGEGRVLRYRLTDGEMADLIRGCPRQTCAAKRVLTDAGLIQFEAERIVAPNIHRLALASADPSLRIKVA